MKKKIPKILLILSFAPYIFCLICGIYCFVNEFTFFSYTTYGLEAFKNGIVFIGLLLCYYLVIPVCLAYQIIYLIIYIVRSRRRKKISQGQSAVE